MIVSTFRYTDTRHVLRAAPSDRWSQSVSAVHLTNNLYLFQMTYVLVPFPVIFRDEFCVNLRVSSKYFPCLCWSKYLFSTIAPNLSKHVVASVPRDSVQCFDVFVL